MQRIFAGGFSMLLLLTFCSAQDSAATPGSIRGEVVTRNQNGEPAVLPGARIVPHGPINMEAQSDASGAFAIEGLPPGMYDIEASAPGLNSAVAIEVKPGVASIVPMELAMAAVADTLTVAANDPPAMAASAQKNTITQSVVEAAPNQTEALASKDENCSLSDGMRQLITERRLRAFEIGDAQWQDLDTPGALAHAEGIFAGYFHHEPAFERVAHV